MAQERMHGFSSTTRNLRQDGALCVRCKFLTAKNLSYQIEASFDTLFVSRKLYANSMLYVRYTLNYVSTYGEP